MQSIYLYIHNPYITIQYRVYRHTFTKEKYIHNTAVYIRKTLNMLIYFCSHTTHTHTQTHTHTTNTAWVAKAHPYSHCCLRIHQIFALKLNKTRPILISILTVMTNILLLILGRRPLKKTANLTRKMVFIENCKTMMHASVASKRFVKFVEACRMKWLEHNIYSEL